MTIRQRYIEFESPPVRHNAPITSREAAESMEPHASRLALKVLAWITHEHGATCAEVEQALELSHQTASARIWELQRSGLIRDSGEKRRTPSGRRAIVWERR